MENYKKLKKIGKGSFGEVSLVCNLTDDKFYAMKKISISALNCSSISPLNEIQLMQNLNHPNIIKYYNSFEHKGKLCIIMEYADSGDLYKKVLEFKQNKEYFYEKQILSWLVQLCSSLNYLHENKILHRDIKISNIFLTQSDMIKLGDFGISKKLESTTDFTKTTVGTPFYFPPEMLDRKKYDHYNYMVDVWMLGCVLYELCTFERPFYNKGEGWDDILHKICFETPKPIPPIYSSFLEKLISKMLCKIPTNRIKISEILELKEIQETIEELKKKNPFFKEYCNKSTLSLPQNSLTKIIKQRKNSFILLKKSPQIFYSDPALFFYDSNEEKKETQQPLTSKKCLLPNIEEKPKLNSFPPPNFRKAYQKEISINTAELDNNYKHKDNNLIDSVKNSDIPAIPTEKFQSQNFLFQNSNDRPTPNSSNRTILSLEFLKTKLGNEKFTKMVELIESSCNPLKSLDDRKKAIEIIGEKNIECLEIYKFLISNAVTPKIKVRSKDDQFSGI